jgi:hypothetical protein
LNAIYNREEEERIRKEEAAKEDRWHFVEKFPSLSSGWLNLLPSGGIWLGSLHCGTFFLAWTSCYISFRKELSYF